MFSEVSYCGLYRGIMTVVFAVALISIAICKWGIHLCNDVVIGLTIAAVALWIVAFFTKPRSLYWLPSGMLAVVLCGYCLWAGHVIG